MQEIISDLRIRFSVIAILIAFAVYALALTATKIKEMRFIGAGVSATNTIQISGEGEVFAVPDIATFTLTVREEAKEVKIAQTTATKKINDIISYLKSSGVEAKDIKTQQYNVSPKYEWQETQKCARDYCPPGKQVLIGFEVYQTLSVKVRDTDSAGEILSASGQKGVSEVSGLSFTIDDDEKLKTEARAKAIEDARNKANILSKDLGVSLVRVVGFSEGKNFERPIYAKAMFMDAVSAMESQSPEIPVGENRIVSNVTITYEIR